jgi:predicted dehydrogenase
MSKKLRFGVLSTANIGLKNVIPAMQKGELTSVTAIASRDLGKARDAAAQLGIPTAYGSYEELLADPNIDAIYNPLPNQLHVPWTAKAAEAGKHVLCEKPLSMTVAEAKILLEVRARTGVKICEAFMIRSAPQWLRVRELLAEGRIGELRAVNAHFSYFNVNPADIRNHVESGGGGVYDIGCYCIQASRFAFNQEPRRVVALVDRDPAMGTDRLASAILDFPSGQAILTFSPLNDLPSRILIASTGDLKFDDIVAESFATADQYTLQGDAFARAVFADAEVPVPLEDSIGNMAVIEAIFRSANSGQWETVQQ